MDMDDSGGGGNAMVGDGKGNPGGGDHQEGGAEAIQADLRGHGRGGEDDAMEMGQLEKAVEEIQEVTDAVVKGSLMIRIDPPKPVAMSEPVHPLLIVDILEVILKHVIAQPVRSDVARDVRNIRLVSITWKDVVTPLYRRNRADFISIDAARVDHRGMEYFLETMKDCTILPVRSYVVYCNLHVMKHQELVKKFLQICGQEAETLIFWPLLSHFGGGAVESAEDVDNSWNNDLSELNLPELKTLHFTPLSLSKRCLVYPTLVNFLKIVLNAATELKEFQITGIIENAEDVMEMQQLANAVHTGLPATVKNLKMHPFLPVCGQVFQKLRETGVQLEEFEFEVGSTVDKDGFCQFLESQSSTLKTLKIRNKEEPSSSTLLDIPRMEELLNLDFKYIIPNRLSFAESFPKVKALNLTGWWNEVAFLELLASVEKTKTAPAIKTIYMPSIAWNQAGWALPLKRMSVCFPMISELHVESNDITGSSLQEVFPYFTNVERLEITFTYPYGEGFRSADAVLSGVRESDCKRIREAGNFDGVSLERFQRRPSILNMTKLKKLILQGVDDRIVVLSDLSAYFLFLQMPGLGELTTHRSRLSPRYEELLARQVKLTLTT